jgi:hypothetical protein
VVLGPRGRRGRPESDDLAGGLGRGSGWGGSRVHEGSVWVPTCGREATSHHGRRSRAAGVAGSSTPASWQPSLGNKWPGQLRWILTKVPRALGSWETERAQEFTSRPQWWTAAALDIGVLRAHTPASSSAFYRRSCLGGEVTTIAHVGHRSQGMGRWGGGSARGVRRRRDWLGGAVTVDAWHERVGGERRWARRPMPLRVPRGARGASPSVPGPQRGFLAATRAASCDKGQRAPAPKKSFHATLFDRVLLKNFQLKCTKVWIGKL